MPSTPCFDYAAAYLSKYPKTTKELIKKLKEKQFSDEDIEMTIPRLEQSGFLNDMLWAQLYIQSLGRKGKPKSVIAMKLREKGISKEIFEQVWDTVGEDVTDTIVEKGRRDLEKMQAKGLDIYTIKQKLYTKGYSKDVITSILNLEQE